MTESYVAIEWFLGRFRSDALIVATFGTRIGRLPIDEPGWPFCGVKLYASPPLSGFIGGEVSHMEVVLQLQIAGYRDQLHDMERCRSRIRELCDNRRGNTADGEVLDCWIHQSLPDAYDTENSSKKNIVFMNDLYRVPTRAGIDRVPDEPEEVP